MIDITIDMVRKLRKLTDVSVMECKKALVEAQGNIELAIDNMRKLGLAKNTKRTMREAKEGIILTKIFKNGKYGIILELNCETDFVARNSVFRNFGKVVIDTMMMKQISDLSVLQNFFKEQCNELMNRFDENIKISRCFVLQGDTLACYSHGTRIGVLVDGSSITSELLKHIAMHIAAYQPEYIYSSDIPKAVIDREYEIQMNIVSRLDKKADVNSRIIQGRMQKFISSISLINQPFLMNVNSTVGEILSMYGSKVNHFVRFEMGG
ncbi:elongation factor Ts [Blochmannia endosymbiont of Colobopsis nipponica]|uniref:translation elongation factor Ts n=1 Tax=Blochmannia endosymbiont of Colobopsis nipponica TaxID=2681987 RepID=UPI00177B0FCF|nr:translation elongation factor Ts [Blochmannia endosymbiont of Colobopsis nipponica]QOI11162.1 elongation factor Ts [Blochmannia endosymbiont of Colobopsis nipponica]